VSIVREDQPDQKEIVAYVVTNPDGKITGTELRRYLRQRLPDYMVPSCLLSLPALPLLPNGKVNRAALPSPSAAAILTDEEGPAALTPTQEVLLEIFRSVLRAEKVELKDDFFDLGGHSVLVTQVVSRVRQAFQVEISMRHVFAAPTVAALAEVIENLLDQQIQAMSAEELHQLASSTALKQS
jgi:acyl carrier protein